MKRTKKIVVWGLCISFIVILAVLWICNQIVTSNALGMTCDDVDCVQYREVGLLLGQAEHLGLDVEGLQAFNATSPVSELAIMTYVREYFARVKMFWDLWTFDEKEGVFLKKAG